VLPVGDNIQTIRPPVVVVVIIILCFIIFVAQLMSDDGGRALVERFGFVPAKLFGRNLLPLDPLGMPLGATLVTYVFLHGSWAHLLGNMLYLWIFADNVEDATGHPQFIIFFLVTSMIAAIAHAWPDPTSFSPIIGASGGVSGVLGAYLLLHPKAEISIAVPVFLVVQIVQLPAWVILAAWFVFNFVLDVIFGSAAGIAFRAHIGGFIAGIVLIPFFAPELRATLRTRLGI
jgi:membrane associated rhomboid family serine protease